MSIVEGHVIVLSLPFANGNPCTYKRPFLVIEKTNSILKLLNISSIEGKEHKLLFPSNVIIREYNPPLDYPSFLKLDELYVIDYFDELIRAIYKRRPPLNTNEFNRLLDRFSNYKNSNNVAEVKYMETMVKQLNFT